MKWIHALLYDTWKTKLKKTVNFYNRANFYQNFAKGQIMMPLGLLNETLWILTYLAVIGIRPTTQTIAGAYVLIFILLVALGKFLIWLGWMKYLQKLGNEQNPEIREIVEWVREQKAKK